VKTDQSSKEIGKVTWSIGDTSALGVIKEWFTAGDELCFFTESGNHFPARYLIGEDKRER
jgi:hypothetical protein